MIARFPRRLRLAFASPAVDVPTTLEPEAGLVTFVAYGEDCILSGDAILDADRLTDMLNDHDEYHLAGVTVDRLDDGEPLDVAEIVVPRDEIFLVHATGPRGDAARRHRTTPQYLAMQLGPYQVRGFFHALPGADPVDALRRRKTMVPITDARIGYALQGVPREVAVDTLIVNRDQIDWVQQITPGLEAFPPAPTRLAAEPA